MAVVFQTELGHCDERRLQRGQTSETDSGVMSDERERTLDEIEEKIKKLDELETEIWFQQGLFLSDAKKKNGHGKFEDWFQRCQFSFSRATRANRMKYYRDMLGRWDFHTSVNLAKLRARMKGESPDFKDLIDIDKLVNFSDPESRRRLQQFIDGERDEKDPLLKEVFDLEKEIEVYRLIRQGEMDFIMNIDDMVTATENFVRDPENLTIKPDAQQELIKEMKISRKAFDRVKQIIELESVEPEPLSPKDE